MATSLRDAVTLLASGTVTADSTGTTAVRLLERIVGGGVSGLAFVLDVTAAATAVDDTLDVFVQTKLDGTNYVDVVHFTQVLGNGGAKRYFAKIVPSAALTEFENATALGAAASRGLFGTDWRCRYTITDAGADNASFTFSVVAVPM